MTSLVVQSRPSSSLIVNTPGVPGPPAPALQVQYSIDGSSWSTSYISNAVYIRLSLDGGSTYPVGPIRLRGDIGVDGNSVLVGEGDPSSGLGKVGDSYIDKVSWGFWEKRSVIGWVNTGNVGSNFAAKTFVHQQIAASDEWVIEHNLGKKPSVTVVSSSGEVVLGKVVYMSDNALTIYFRAPFSGEAYLN